MGILDILQNPGNIVTTKWYGLGAKSRYRIQQESRATLDNINVKILIMEQKLPFRGRRLVVIVMHFAENNAIMLRGVRHFALIRLLS